MGECSRPRNPDAERDIRLVLVDQSLTWQGWAWVLGLSTWAVAVVVALVWVIRAVL